MLPLQAIVNPLAAIYVDAASKAVCDAGMAAAGTVVTAITEEELVVTSRAEAGALGVELVERLVVARAPDGTLMFFMLPKGAAEGKAVSVARRLGSGLHPREYTEPERWGGHALQGVAGMRQPPSVEATIKALRELHRKLGAHSTALDHRLTLCTASHLYLYSAPWLGGLGLELAVSKGSV